MPEGIQIDEVRLIELIKEFKECGVNSLVFLGGGEPTIHPAFEKIIDATNSSNIKVALLQTVLDLIDWSLIETQLT